jgi:hypothetical protein
VTGRRMAKTVGFMARTPGRFLVLEGPTSRPPRPVEVGTGGADGRPAGAPYFRET